MRTPSISRPCTKSSERRSTQPRFFGRAADQGDRRLAMAREALVVRLALEPAEIDLLADHTHLEVREGDVPVERAQVASAEVRVPLGDLLARRKARLRGDRLQPAHHF